MSGLDLDRQLVEIVARLRQTVRAERATLFLHDAERGELWSRVLEGGELREIRIGVGEGLAGHVMATGEPLRLDDARLDPRFAARFDRESGFVTRSVLCLPLVNLDGERIGVVQALNKRDGTFDARDEEVLAALAAQVAIAIENGRLAADLERASAAEAKLAGELEKKHRQLGAAYTSLEASHRELARAMHRSARLRWVAGGAAIALFVALAAGVWLRSSPARMADPGERRGAAGEAVVARRPLVVTVPLAGKLEPAALTAVVSPVSGAVRRAHVRYGERVAAGQLLAELDTTQVEIELRTARAGAIRAEQRARELAGWAEGPEVANARRALARAELELEAARRKLEETRQLHGKGIVRRGELDDAERAFANEELDYRSVEQALAAVAERGDEDNRRIAEMELENARVALGRVEQRLAEAHVVAPIAGVALVPEGGGRLAEGSRVEAGEPLLAIGDLAQLAVVCRVDEVEARRLRLGQRATVRGEALGGEALAASVRSVAAAGEEGGFEVALALEAAPAELAAGFRLGLTAAAEVVVFESAAALVVPVVAVTSDDGGDWVEVLLPNGEAERRRVELGEATIDLVEVRSGLVEGERLRIGGGA